MLVLRLYSQTSICYLYYSFYESKYQKLWDNFHASQCIRPAYSLLFCVYLLSAIPERESKEEKKLFNIWKRFSRTQFPREYYHSFHAIFSAFSTLRLLFCAPFSRFDFFYVFIHISPFFVLKMKYKLPAPRTDEKEKCMKTKYQNWETWFYYNSFVFIYNLIFHSHLARFSFCTHRQKCEK